MFTVFVTLTVKEDLVEEFVEGIRINAKATMADEPGCLRFDVHRNAEHSNVFHLYEIYADADAFYADHRQAPHYAAWRAVADRCVEPGGHVNTYAVPEFPGDLPEAHW